MRVPEARRSDADGVLMLFLHRRSAQASLEDFTCFATGRVLGPEMPDAWCSTAADYAMSSAETEADTACQPELTSV
jgi:hypothetical protein